jgi:hypothetical protein
VARRWRRRTSEVATTGITFFHLPLASSPLIDQGPINCSPVDQRGAARVGMCDSGAVEFGGRVPVLWLPLARR